MREQEITKKNITSKKSKNTIISILKAKIPGIKSFFS